MKTARKAHIPSLSRSELYNIKFCYTHSPTSHNFVPSPSPVAVVLPLLGHHRTRCNSVTCLKCFTLIKSIDIYISKQSE
jgi:hypothetical protein